MAEATLKNIGYLLREKRGGIGLRDAAQEIGISPATLSRIETGRLPDIETFAKICQWLQVDASQVLGVQNVNISNAVLPSVHLKAKRNLSPTAAQALSQLILAASANFDACFTNE